MLALKINMEIIYKDSYTDNVITEQQALLIGEYDKIYLESESVKKIFRFRNFILKFAFYYINSTENELEIVESLTPLVDISINIISQKQPLGAFFVQEERLYRDNVLDSKSKVLLDEFDNEVTVIGVDVDTNLPILGEVIKYHYGINPTEKKDEIFTAEYNDDGSLLEIEFRDIDPLGKVKYYTAGNFSELEARFPGNPDLSYYLTGTFEP